MVCKPTRHDALSICCLGDHIKDDEVDLTGSTHWETRKTCSIFVRNLKGGSIAGRIILK
jgi:hypothetical protein